MELEVDSWLVSLKNGKWQVSNGFFEYFDGLGEIGWFLLVQVVNYWYMFVVELVCLFCVLLDWCLDDLMIFFFVFGGGVGLYIDQYDVFIIQGMGSCCWCVGDKLLMCQFCLYLVLLYVDLFLLIIDEDLQSGDIFYILLGFLYDGIIYEIVLNYFVGFCGLNGCDLISSFVDYVLENDFGGEYYSDLDFICCEYLGWVEEYEFECLCIMMIDMICQLEDFKQWFGSFVIILCYELDIVLVELLYEEEEVVDVLLGGEKFFCLSGLCVLYIGDSFFVYSE